MLPSINALAGALLFSMMQLAPSPTPNTPPFRGDEFVLGSPTAPITVVEYLSDTCSHCAAFNRDVYPRLVADYIDTGRLRLVIRELTTAPTIVSAAGFLFARCRGEAGYWGAVRRLLDSEPYVLSGQTQAEQLTRAADVAGLTPVQAQVCLSDGSAIAALNDRRQSALDAGADSTPTFLFNGHAPRVGGVLAGKLYEGGELSLSQFSTAYLRTLKGEDISVMPSAPPVLHARRERR